MRNDERSQMTKEQFISLWNADNWEAKSHGVYFTAHRAGKELYLNVSFDEQFVPSPEVGYDTF